jgi:hypothetical protein
MISNSLNSRSENVVIETVIISELKFCDVERHIFGADLMERADDAALEDAPEAFDGLGMNGTNNVLALRVVNGGVRISLVEALVANPLIGQCRASLLFQRQLRSQKPSR